MINRIAWHLRNGSKVIVVVLVLFWSLIVGTAVYECFERNTNLAPIDNHDTR